MRKLFALLNIYSVMAYAQIPLVFVVKDAALQGNIQLAEQELAQAKGAYGITPEYLEALSWVGRGQLALKNYGAAGKNAAEVRQLCLAQLAHRKLDADKNLPLALGAAIEVSSQALAAEGSRDQAVVFLRDEARRWHGTSIASRIQKNLNLLTLEGKPAPALDTVHRIGAKHPLPLSSLHGHPVLLFFWAHWCSDCKIEIASVRKLNEAYSGKGLRVVAPTQHYGYVAGGAEALPDAEAKYIAEVWTKYYARIGTVDVPLSERNFQTYGVSTTPTLVLIDKEGVVRLYRPGQISYEELAARVEKLL